MAITITKKLGRTKGFNPSTDQLSTMSLATAGTVYEGSFLYEDADEATDRLKLATAGSTPVHAILLERITLTGPDMLERMFKVDVGEKASGEKCAIALLRPGSEWETAVVATSGTGALSAGTPAGTALSIINGEVVIKQASGNGDVEVARLVENSITATAPWVRLMVTAVGGGL